MCDMTGLGMEVKNCDVHNTSTQINACNVCSDASRTDLLSVYLLKSRMQHGLGGLVVADGLNVAELDRRTT
jgi:PP-loop superfamily ATP-utilizing enzyme